MIILQTLKWDNCFSYGSGNELNLEANTVTQILGTNGMGKSSIPLIIEEALYNKNSKGIKKADIPNRYVKDGYNIYLAFTKDSDRYEITINRKTNIKVKLEKNGTDISSHTATNTYKTLQEILGVDFKTFSQLVYQNTNASLQFLTATDANRKKFLIDLLHLEKYVELFEIFKGASKEVASVSSTIAGKLATVEKWLDTNKLSDTSILPMLDLQINTSQAEEGLRYWTTQKLRISDTNNKIRTNIQYKMLLDKINIVAIQTSEVVWTPYDDLQEELGSLQAVSTGAQRTLDKLERISDECPTCKQPIDVSAEKALIEVERKNRDEAHAKALIIRPQIQKIKVDNAQYEQNKKDISTWEELYRSYDKSLPTALLEEAEIDASLKHCEEMVADNKRLITENAAENERRTKLNTRIEVIQEQTEEFVEQQEEYDGKLLGNQKLESNLNILKKSFSTNGLLAYKIENLVGELEELANEYLAELSDGRFTLEFVVSNDKLNVEITDNGNVVDILALSSGELARVNTATLIAIRKLMSSISKSKINILFLDEVTNVLDDQGREKLVEVLLREDLNTYIVSHGWSHPLLEKIEVVKDGNISILE
jgi:DNA repair exonuclease SbcCD ATPase subunit|tara:strand:+ start:764 stop:2554 length:1791 start_codon:yes stop_codon:yes gene_type:complete